MGFYGGFMLGNVGAYDKFFDLVRHITFLSLDDNLTIFN
jgi:hypothetical protein